MDKKAQFEIKDITLQALFWLYLVHKDKIFLLTLFLFAVVGSLCFHHLISETERLCDMIKIRAISITFP